MFIGTAVSEFGDKIKIYDLEAMVEEQLRSRQGFVVCMDYDKKSFLKQPYLTFVLSEECYASQFGKVDLEARTTAMPFISQDLVDYNFIMQVNTPYHLKLFNEKLDRISAMIEKSLVDSWGKEYTITQSFVDVLLSVIMTKFVDVAISLLGDTYQDWFMDNIQEILKSNGYFLRFAAIDDVCNDTLYKGEDEFIKFMTC